VCDATHNSTPALYQEIDLDEWTRPPPERGDGLSSLKEKVRAKKEEAAAANNSQRDEARNRWLNTAAEPPQPVAPPEPPKVPPPPEPSIFQVDTYQSLIFAVDRK
jgi:hypothetical protein